MISASSLNLTWLSRRALPLIMQSEAAECGLACVAMVAGFHGYQSDLVTMRQRFSIGLRGTSMKDLIQMAQALKLTTRAIRIDLDDLPYVAMPAILHWEGNHFVVLQAVKFNARGGIKKVVIHDPAKGRRELSVEEVSAGFTGVALELAPSPDFAIKQEKQTVSIAKLVGQVRGLSRATAQILALMEKWVEFKMIGLQGERLADIVLSPQEPDAGESSAGSHDIEKVSVEIRNLSFRYADGEPWVIRNLDLVIQSSESVALVGASGCGKTTLVKLLLGLLVPTEGEILVNGMPLQKLGIQR